MATTASGYDRDDGSSGRNGVATPSVAKKVQSGGGNTDVTLIPFCESPDSPTIEQAEQTTTTKRFEGSWENVKVRMLSNYRGYIEQDSFGNYTKILSGTAQYQKGGTAIMAKVSEGLFQFPPEEFSRTRVDLGVNIIKHPRYLTALSPDLAGTTVVHGTAATVSLSNVKQATIRAIQTYQESPIYPSADNINGLFHNGIVDQFGIGTIQVHYSNSSFDPTKYEDQPRQWDGVSAFPKGDDPRTDGGSVQDPGNFRYLLVNVDTSASEIQFALAAAKEILAKVWRQEDSPYISGYQISWSQYSALEQYIHPGGIVEAPFNFPAIFGSDAVASPELPAYFWCPAFVDANLNLDTSKTIFDRMANINPQCFSSTGAAGGSVRLSCLRLADDSVYDRTWHKVTRTWLVAPIGMWDTDINSSGARPVIANGGPNYGYHPLV